MNQKQIGVEFEIGSPLGLQTTCNRIKKELNISGLKTKTEMTVETPARYDGEIVTPIWPLAKGISNLKRIFKWFEKNDIVTNDTCGFHVNISFKNKSLNWMIDPTTLVLCFNEEKWLKVCKRHGNEYTDCHIDELLTSKPRKPFTDETKALSWIDKEIKDGIDERYHSVNWGHLETDNPYVEYRCLGGIGYHLRYGLMSKAIVEMARNLERALPNGKGTGFKTVKVRECFLPKRESIFIPH